MSIQIKNVIVAGATGNLGGPLVNHLVEAGFNVSGLTRQSGASLLDGVKAVQSDYSPDSLVQAFKGQDAVIAAVGFGALGDQKKLIDAAIKASVKVFLPGEFGSDTTNPYIKSALPFASDKSSVVDYLKEHESQINWVGVISGPFFDMGLTAGFLGVDLKTKKATLYDGGDVPLTVSTLGQVGRGVAASLRNLDQTANKFVYISSTTTTQNKLLEAAEKVTGKKFQVTHVSTAEIRQKGYEKLKSHDYSGVLDLLQSIWFGKDKNLGDHTGLLWDEKLGLKPESADNVLHSVVASF
ncbi:hypothetical protein MRS44_016734 [Fusarium solani]|uniref:Isoflavone reductase family protein n=1 Tax=Fusarium solani TaxID=169388 RepID=A0A9P9KES5_FUSSL|nr:isoflavone reductase family protein [Fusarium solani]KAH7254595.1 isoflavone reductase family protein [Fusarium solani]KAJ3456711.1 hypothetical protein MRS44_016734 [Fusarium solani]